MKLSVIIPSSSPAPTILATISSCLRQSLYASGDMEILLVCDRNRDAVLVAMAPFVSPNFRVFSSPIPGANAARSHGLRAARGEIVYFLDDDCKLRSSKHCERMLTKFQANPGVVGFGGAYSSPQTANLAARYYNTFTRVWLWLYSDGNGTADTKVLLGGNAAYRKQVLDTLSFNSSLQYGATESELHDRMLTQGLRLCVAKDLMVEHNVRANLRSLCRRAWQQSFNRGRYQIRHDRERSYWSLLHSYWGRGRVARRAFLWISPYLILGQFAYYCGSIWKGHR